MASWGDWSDGVDDDFLDGVDEWSNSEDDELIRNINEDEILRSVNGNDEHEIEPEQTGRGEKRKVYNVNLSDSEGEPSKKRKTWNQNVVLSDTENDTIGDEGSISQEHPTTEEPEQTGRGKKRKAENHDVEQEDYYRIKPVRDHHSQKFNMTAKNYRVQFNNALDDVDLLKSQNRTYDIFDHLIRDVTEGMNSTDQVRSY